MGYVEKLEAAYGPPSQKGFGGAVFHEVLQPANDLATAALAKYRHFVGPLWSRFGEQAWMGPPEFDMTLHRKPLLSPFRRYVATTYRPRSSIYVVARAYM